MSVVTLLDSPPGATPPKLCFSHCKELVVGGELVVFSCSSSSCGGTLYLPGCNLAHSLHSARSASCSSLSDSASTISLTSLLLAPALTAAADDTTGNGVNLVVHSHGNTGGSVLE